MNADTGRIGVDGAASNGTGVDAVDVWAFSAAGVAPRFLGSASYGLSRPDVGSVFGAGLNARILALH